MLSRRWFLSLVVCLASPAFSADTPNVSLRGEIRDAESGDLLPARLYIQSADGAKWFFAKSADAKGSAIVYDRAREKSIEKHTTLSAHPFVAELPPGKYTLTAERGKEYLTATQEVEVADKPVSVTLKLKRWINMAERGWYSGDTHVHRNISELSNVALAEDLNMIYPMSQWVTVTHTLPEKGRVDPQPIPTAPIFADPTHAIVPFNTEYEIFSVGTKRHTLGAVLILGQKEPLKIGIPPLKAVAEEAHRQGGLLDLEKHSWAWTPIIAPVMKADLYPLSNNHVWRTEFAFKSWTIENNWRDNPRIEIDKDGFTEAGWLHYGWEQYYAMLNCGLRMRPTAGTANGVHPVPAGFSRVYVDLGDEKFTPELWQKRLNEGRSFVTTGPMLALKVSNAPLGAPISMRRRPNGIINVVAYHGSIESEFEIDRIDLLFDGRLQKTFQPKSEQHDNGHFVTQIDEQLQHEESCWVAIRCFEKLPTGRLRFAHSAPTFIEYQESAIRPHRDQVRYLMQRCEEEIARNKEVLSDAELAEYREALEFYRGKLETAR
ncbi:MAG: hypothetical protein FD138_937 [Planctomycetota bacterium]|nr:MAG: hypothetical protein FD138_937 [Planctomycetota bacterium]